MPAREPGKPLDSRLVQLPQHGFGETFGARSNALQPLEATLATWAEALRPATAAESP